MGAGAGAGATEGVLGDTGTAGDSERSGMADGSARVPEVLTPAELEGFLAGVMGPELLEPALGAPVGEEVEGFVWGGVICCACPGFFLACRGLASLFGGLGFAPALFVTTRVCSRFSAIKLRNSRVRYPLRTGHKRDFANVSFVCLPALPPDFSEGRPGCRWTRKSCGWC